ncbi:hypothetical protein MACH17_09240 [Phaeobacter inhibens]|nr:hypothetical protein MACH17_09240 [Phaeobacter inhibens]
MAGFIDYMDQRRSSALDANRISAVTCSTSAFKYTLSDSGIAFNLRHLNFDQGTDFGRCQLRHVLGGFGG